MDSETWLLVYIVFILGGFVLLIGWNVVRSIRDDIRVVRKAKVNRTFVPPERKCDSDSVTGTGLDGLL